MQDTNNHFLIPGIHNIIEIFVYKNSFFKYLYCSLHIIPTSSSSYDTKCLLNFTCQSNTIFVLDDIFQIFIDR